MDPLGTILNIYAVFELLRDCVETAMSNKAQCVRLGARVDVISKALQQYFPVPEQSAEGPPTYTAKQREDIGKMIDANSQSPALVAALGALADVLNQALTLVNQFHGGRNKNFQQMCIAKMKRVVLMGNYQGDFQDINQALAEQLQLLQTILALDFRQDFKDWAQQDKTDQQADMQAVRVQLSGLQDATGDGFKRNDQYSQEILDMNHQANKQLQSLSQNVKMLMQMVATGGDLKCQAAGDIGVMALMSQAAAAGGSASSPFSSSSAPASGYNPASQIDPRISTALYRIEFVHLLATGPLCKVYSGHWAGHEVAIKSVESDWSSEIAERFFREVEITAGFRSCYTVQLYAACFEQGRACMVLEYMCGGNLFDRISRDGRCDPTWAFAVARDLASALAYVHSMGFWHCDVRSHNVLLTGTGRAKLCGFGKAKDKRVRSLATDLPYGQPIATSLSLSFNQLVLALWSPPEICNHTGVVATSDVYGYGVVLYELFTGFHPFSYLWHDPTSLKACLTDVCSIAPYPCFLSAHPIRPEWNVPPAIVKLIAECTGKISGARPAVDQLLETVLYDIALDDIVPSAAAEAREPYSPWRQVYKHALQAQASGNFEAAYQLLESVVQSNDAIYGTRACTDLALLMLSQNRDYHRALRLLEFAGNRGHDRANIALCQYVIRGSNSNNQLPDRPRAIAIYKLLEHSSHPKTQQTLPSLKKLLQI